MAESPKEPQQHRNDIYGDLEAKPQENPAIPAATVVLLRDDEDRSDEVEVLMLRKNSKIAFGGMWVFPGGRIEDDDHHEGSDLEGAARRAAAREAEEEAGVRPSPEDFVWFAHWTPPPSTPRRYATWFFATRAEGLPEVSIDGGEIHDHHWISPAHALERHGRGEIDLAPPTWVTLYHLSRYRPVSGILEHFSRRQARYYETHVCKRSDGVRVALWAGDAGYDGWDADAEGARHRLVMAQDGFEFEPGDIEY